MPEEIPQWALDKAEALVRYHKDPAIFWMDRHRNAFARYIAEHEEAPVDPLLIEAREIAAAEAVRQGFASVCDETVAGDRDEEPDVKLVLTALKRGIEIAEKRNA